MAAQDTEQTRAKVDGVPDGLWVKCTHCSEMLYSRELARDLKVCRRCNFHFELSAQERIQVTVDPGSFQEHDAQMRSANPLGFPDYPEKLTRAQQGAGTADAMIWGECRIGGAACVIGASEGGFMRGSMGSVVGEKTVRAAEFALQRRLPVVMFCCSGGARMQEGIVSLMQMAKTSAAVARLHQAGLPYICVFTNPLTAGVLASFASLGDVLIAEPGALVGFAGPRVIEQNLKIKLPPGTHTSEFQIEHGMVDLVVPRREMLSTLTRVLRWAAAPNSSPAPITPGDQTIAAEL